MCYPASSGLEPEGRRAILILEQIWTVKRGPLTACLEASCGEPWVPPSETLETLLLGFSLQPTQSPGRSECILKGEGQ